MYTHQPYDPRHNANIYIPKLTEEQRRARATPMENLRSLRFRAVPATASLSTMAEEPVSTVEPVDAISPREFDGQPVKLSLRTSRRDTTERTRVSQFEPGAPKGPRISGTLCHYHETPLSYDYVRRQNDSGSRPVCTQQQSRPAIRHTNQSPRPFGCPSSVHSALPSQQKKPPGPIQDQGDS